jgi:DNA-binding transcriptional regulator YiaG
MASVEQTAELQRRASTAIREQEGLLQPEEITAIRESLGLSKADFERLLGSGEKTAVRWEKALVFQSQHANELMIALREVPEFAEHLARRRGIQLRRPNDGVARGTAIPFRSAPAQAPQRHRKMA